MHVHCVPALPHAEMLLLKCILGSFLGCSTFPGVLAAALFACTSTKLFVLACASLLYSSTVCVHSHYVRALFQSALHCQKKCVPALVTCISIAPGGFLDCSGLLLGCSTFWEAFWTALDCRAAELQSCRAAGLQSH